MEACDAKFADFVRSQVQTPTAFCIVQQPISGPSPVVGTGVQETQPTPFHWQICNQLIIDKMTSVQISRSTDRTSDTAQFTLEDDDRQYAAFRKDGQGKYSAAFQPGFIYNRFQLWLGFQGPNFTGGARVNYDLETILRFTGSLQTDDNPTQSFATLKSASLVDLTNQFSFDIYDTFPHPLYGQQNLSFFDPDYNLDNENMDGQTWTCMGKMFTSSNLSLVYGSTHQDPRFYVDFTCGGTAAIKPLVYDVSHSSFDKATNTGTYCNSSGTTLWTFDYANGIISFKDQWVNARLVDSDPFQIAKITVSNVHVGDTVINVNRPDHFVAGGTAVLGLASDANQEWKTVKSVQSGASTITLENPCVNPHNIGDPAMGNWVVSVAGNPTYMAPEDMIYLILVSKGNWDPTMLKLDNSNIIVNQYIGQDMAAWDCIKEICDLTCPRYMPWIMYVDMNGKITFEESTYDAPYVKHYIDNRDLLTLDLSYSSQQISTVVRAEGECFTSEGTQSVTSLSYNMKAIDRYGQTEALLLDQHLTYNVRQLTTTQAVAAMNMLTASTLAQVSEPILTLTATIWPDPTLEINDKIRVTSADTGENDDFIISAIDETVSDEYSMQITAQKVINPANYLIGIPAGVNYDNLLWPAVTSLPSTSLIKEINMGTENNMTYVWQKWKAQQDPVTLDDIVGKWVLDGTPMHFDVLYDAKQPPAPSQNPWSYSNRPPNCGWVPQIDPQTGDTVYKGTQPSGGLGNPNEPGWSLWVGPDSVFYTYNHAGNLGPGDLNSFWIPPGNSYTPGQGSGTKPWTGYQWCWFYLLLDGNQGPGKAWRPVMRLNPGLEAQAFNVPTTGTKKTNTWSHPPGPETGGNSFYYKNLVVGCSNLTIPPAGFHGAQPWLDGIGKDHGGQTTVQWPMTGPHGTKGFGWMPTGTITVPVANAAEIFPNTRVSFGLGGADAELNVPISQVDVAGNTITISSSYKEGTGTQLQHFGGTPGGGNPADCVIKSNAGSDPDDTYYGVAYGPPVGTQDFYVNFQKVTMGHFCLYVISSDGATQFVRIPFNVYL